ncbi:hypothetical protein B566_EDAN015386 [Ephemera danica]|nr:hypothetical protein B566_EDAN015386 [Ephemera danica]
MRFRGKMVDVTAVKQFSNLLITLAKLCKSCVLRICPDKLYFVLNEEAGLPGHVLSWCVMEQSHFFNEYTMEGVSETHNEIVMKFSPEMMSTSLNSKQISLAKSVKIKLTNKQHPCLTFQIELPSQTLLSRTCIHDIPVVLVPRTEWPMYQEPEMPEVDMSVFLTNTKRLRNVVERMKKMSMKLEIRGSTVGELCLSIETDKACVVTHFQDLRVECDTASGRGDSPHTVSLWVDIRKLAQLLAGDHINPDRVICHIVKERLLYMHFTHEALDFHYFIPAISL